MLISALLGALGSVSVMAQTNVYSINTVGYMNMTLVNGYNVITVPLITPTDTNGSYNTIGDLFPNGTGTGGPFNSDQILFLQPNGSFVTLQGRGVGVGGTGWYPSGSYTNQLLPGTAVWYNRTGATTNITVVGTVPTGSVTNPLTAGVNLVGSIVPLVGDLYSNAVAGNDGVHGFTNVSSGDQLSLFDPNAQNFVGTYQTRGAPPNYTLAHNGGSPWALGSGFSGDPIVSNVYEGFFYENNTVPPVTENWVENYSSAQP